MKISRQRRFFIFRKMKIGTFLESHVLGGTHIMKGKKGPVISIWGLILGKKRILQTIPISKNINRMDCFRKLNIGEQTLEKCKRILSRA